MKKFLAGAVTAIAGLMGCAFIVMKLGLIGTNADMSPSDLEAHLMPMAVRASVARRAPEQPNPIPATEESLTAGLETYRVMCARCHGQAESAPSVYGASFYPPAPQFRSQATQYSESQLFWIVKHGVRNTGMPAWGRLLSDDEIWQVSAVVKRFNSLSSTRKGGGGE